MTRRLYVAALFSLFTVASTAAFPQPAAILTLEECVSIALSERPVLAAAEASVKAARQQVRQAASEFFPHVEGDYSFVRRSTTVSALIQGPSGPTTSRQPQLFNFQSGGFSASQLLFDFGKALNTTRAGLANAESVEADRVTVEHQVTLEVKRAYYELVAFRRLLQVAEETETQTRRHLGEVQRRYEVGMAPRFDVTKQEVQVANAELDRLVARNKVDLGSENLRKAMGLARAVDFYPQDRSLDYAQVDVDETTALKHAYANRPELRSLHDRMQAQKHRIAALKTDYLPAAVGMSNYSFTGENSLEDEGWRIGVDIRLSIFNGGLTTAQIGESRAELLKLQAEEAETRQRVSLEARQSYLSLRAAEGRIRVSAKTVEQAWENLAVAEGRYSAGTGNILELTDAQVDLAAARANQIRDLTVYWIAVAEFEYAIGAPLEEIAS